MAAKGKAAKGAVGVKAAKTVAKNPGLLKLGAGAAKPAYKVGKPVAKRQAKKKARQVRSDIAGVGEVFEQAYGAAQNLGLVEQPAEKRTAPRVLVGVAIGAVLTYVITNREQVTNLVS